METPAQALLRDDALIVCWDTQSQPRSVVPAA